MGRSVTRASCHFWCILAIVLDFGVAVLLIVTYKQDIELPFIRHRIQQNLQNYLPTFGTLIGAIVAIVNQNAVMALVTVYARRKMASQGLTFEELSNYAMLAQGGVPATNKPQVLLVAGALLLSVMAMGTAIVQSISPTPENWGAASNMSAVSFAADSGVTPPIFCADAGTSGNSNTFGYGSNCPMDTSFGEMYNAFTDSLRGSLAVNSTWNGVSYPSSLMGISGAISTLPARYTKAISATRLVQPTDTFDTCLPRMVINANCSPNLPNGDNFVTNTISVQGGIPNNIQTVKLCSSNSTCLPTRYAPNYGNGVISVFTDSDPSTGDTTVSLFSVGTYATVLTSGSISCVISAQEVVEPIRITGGASVALFPDLSCSNFSSQPIPGFLQNITRLGGMGLEKMQGADGKLEAVSSIPSGQDVIQALELALERMIGVGATAMYSTIDSLNSTTTPTASWAHDESYLLQTIRFRLGVQGKYTVVFILSPVVLISLLITAWLSIGFSRAAQLGFNPLDPASAIVAGMNRERLPVEIANHSDVNQDEIRKSDVVVRYALLGGGGGANQRMGIEVNGSDYVTDVGAGPLLSPPITKETYTDDSPRGSAFPSPNLNYNGHSGGQLYA